VGSNFDIAEDGRTGTDQDPFSHFRMSFPGFFSCPTKGDVLKEGYVVIDNACFPDHDPGGVIEEQANAQPRGWVDVNLK
jgi:hypothetical protein